MAGSNQLRLSIWVESRGNRWEWEEAAIVVAYTRTAPDLAVAIDATHADDILDRTGTLDVSIVIGTVVASGCHYEHAGVKCVLNRLLELVGGGEDEVESGFTTQTE
jgi:hypothetical protein